MILFFLDYAKKTNNMKDNIVVSIINFIDGILGRFRIAFSYLKGTRFCGANKIGKEL